MTTLQRSLAGSTVAVWLAATALAAPAKPTTINFDADKADKPPANFAFGRTGEGKPGAWLVKGDKTAPSGGKVLAQTDTDETDSRYAVAVAAAPQLADVKLTVKCKTISGKVDQTCGLVMRYQDENNYYLARTNALEGNVRLYYVKAGKRAQLASWKGEVAGGKWFDFGVQIKGDALEVHFAGKKILEAKDATFPAAGKVGFWTKADSVTHFDDLAVTPL